MQLSYTHSHGRIALQHFPLARLLPVLNTRQKYKAATRATATMNGSDAGPEVQTVPAVLTVRPARYTKTLHLVRHGEGYHNVAGHIVSKKCNDTMHKHIRKFSDNDNVSVVPAMLARGFPVLEQVVHHAHASICKTTAC